MQIYLPLINRNNATYVHNLIQSVIISSKLLTIYFSIALLFFDERNDNENQIIIIFSIHLSGFQLTEKEIESLSDYLAKLKPSKQAAGKLSVPITFKH